MTQRILGRYELADFLGRGGMAEVWAAWDRVAGRAAAVKFLAPYGLDGATAALEQRFLREARITAELSHPGVPFVHDSGKLDDGRLYLVMELVPGDTLSALLKESGPFPVHRAASVAAQTAGVLAHAHASGVMHRDLKPSNLMLTPDGAVKVLDFGIAAALEPGPDEPRLTRTNATPGTAGFMAPEQAEGRPVAASDFYALGCVLYELLTGVPPFTAPNDLLLMYRHVTDPPPPVASHRAELPDAFADLVMRLLAKDPADRPTADEVRDTARRWAAEGAGHAVAVAPRERSVTPAEAPRRTRAAESDDPASVTVLLEQYDRLRRSGEPGRAFEGFTELAEELQGSRGADDPEVLACRVGAARCLATLGRTAAARDAFEALLPAQEHALGAVHPAVFDTRYQIGVLMAGAGDRARARELLAHLRDAQRAALPEADRGLARTIDLIARLDRILGSVGSL